MQDFGKIFRELLCNSKIPNTKIAEMMGISRSQLYDIKDKETVSHATIEKVCKIFEVSPMIFFDRSLLQYGTGGLNYTNAEFKNNTVLGQATMNVGSQNDEQSLKDVIAEKERFIQYLLKEKSGSEDKSL